MTLTALAGLAPWVGDRPSDDARADRLRTTASRLALSDLAFFEGPSYARHPSLTDRFAPFSEHPGAFEHSPAGSLVPPPPRLQAPMP